jgi:hypothetical protein
MLFLIEAQSRARAQEQEPDENGLQASQSIINTRIQPGSSPPTGNTGKTGEPN